MQATVPEAIVQTLVAVSSEEWSVVGSVFRPNLPAAKYKWPVVRATMSGGE